MFYISCFIPRPVGFHLCHSFMHYTFVTILHQVGISHNVEPSHLYFEHINSFGSGCHSRLTRCADILLRLRVVTPTVVLTLLVCRSLGMVGDCLCSVVYFTR